jgi:hypothetical protein
MTDDMAVKDIAVYLQTHLRRYHSLDEIIKILEESLSQFGDVERLWNYFVEHELGLYLECTDGIDVIL